jgi:GNAT superfamily N-acetyltransferase
VTQVVVAEASDLDTLAGLLADAFAELPPSIWLISDPIARREIFPGYFRIFLEHGFASGFVYTTPDLSGVALWLPVHGAGPTVPPGYHQRLPVACAPWTSRFIAFDTALEKRYPVGREHHHLALLGVRPGRQGRGIGTALLAAHQQLLDGEGLPAYLEASSPASRRLYLRHGYEDRGPLIELPGGPVLFPMWREGKGRSEER